MVATLLQVLGLLDVPDSGSYKLMGRETAGLSETELAELRSRSLGFVFQQFNLLARSPARDQVSLPTLYHPYPAPKDRAESLLQAVGLAGRMDHLPSQLSGGQQQRVAIARALMNAPSILLADEPTGNLDSRSSQEILDLLGDLNAQGITIVMVTHEADIAARARRVITMRDGKVLSDVAQPSTPGASAASRMKAPEPLPVGKHSAFRAVSVYAKQAMQALFANKVRSFLSVLGILIGVAAVIAMLAIGAGARKAIQSQLSSLGSNLLMLIPGSANRGGVMQGTGSSIRLSLEDAKAIQTGMSLAAQVGPEVNGRVQAVGNGKNWSTSVVGAGVVYAKMRAAEPALGRFFTEAEVRERARVVLLGVTVARSLFGEDNPIGQSVKLNRVMFQVIGVLPAKGSSGWRDEDDRVLVPVTTAMYRLLGRETIDLVAVEAKSAETVADAQEELTALMRKRLHLAPEKEDPFQVLNLSDIQNAFKATSSTISTLLAVIAGISLLVGGIGIMNIMLVSVTERTREIGLRKALGARGRDILYQFLIESVVISLTGGLIGVALGASISVTVSMLLGWTTELSPTSIALALGFSGFVGIVFGLWPAQKASRLSPILALRYE